MRTINIPNTNITLTEAQIRAAVVELDCPPIKHLDLIAFGRNLKDHGSPYGLALGVKELNAVIGAKTDGVIEMYNSGQFGALWSNEFGLRDLAIGKFQGFKGL